MSGPGVNGIYAVICDPVSSTSQGGFKEFPLKSSRKMRFSSVRERVSIPSCILMCDVRARTVMTEAISKVMRPASRINLPCFFIHDHVKVRSIRDLSHRNVRTLVKLFSYHERKIILTLKHPSQSTGFNNR